MRRAREGNDSEAGPYGTRRSLEAKRDDAHRDAATSLAPPPGYGAYGQQQPRDGTGIASLVLGLIALPFAFALVGVVPGVLASLVAVAMIPFVATYTGEIGGRAACAGRGHPETMGAAAPGSPVQEGSP